MSTAKIIEITSESDKGYEDAVNQGITEASKTVDNIRSAWVKDHEVLVGAGDSRAHRVHMKVTFIVDGKQS
jgi:flavin-binding protein dodecin